MYSLEVCVDSLESAVSAWRGGADELEVCSSLAEGGLTPSAGLVRTVKQRVSLVKINVMIRCRTGSDFCYSDAEMDTMLADVDIFRTMKVDGFVFGALTPDGEIDKTACMKIIRKAGSIPVTFHRAFDACNGPLRSLETIVELGFKRLLTSGQCSSATDEKAVNLITELLLKSKGRIEIMPGAGINKTNVTVLANTGATLFHSSCKKIRHLDRGETPAMGTNESACVYVTDVQHVGCLKAALIGMYADNKKNHG